MTKYTVEFVAPGGATTHQTVSAESWDQAVFHATIGLIADLADLVGDLEEVFNRLCLAAVASEIGVGVNHIRDEDYNG